MNTWYLLCGSGCLKRKPRRFYFLGRPIVLFKTANGEPAALLDRCSHRGAPLSEGRVEGNCVTCPYHGWSFDPSGQCTSLPGSPGPCPGHLGVEAFDCRESQGFLWIRDKTADDTGPCPIRGLGEPGFSNLSWSLEMQTTLEDAAENFLDPTHTHYVHSGLIRTEGTRKPVQAQVRSIEGGVEAEYHEGQQNG
ncbi:MAG: Rieske 2Fe-2S domain-containing protein, partial [Chlamydiia bacterium]|nr:Rieske 2Fe-2S domain-containing protein [Chlamydiia bacterium]